MEKTSNSTVPSGESEPILRGIAIFSVLAIFETLSVGGNALVLLAYAIDKKVRSQDSNAYLAALALVDFLIGLTIIPLGFSYIYHGSWTHGLELCKLWLICCYGLSCLSSAHLTLIAVDRYRILFQGVPYLQRRTVRNIVEIVLVVWIVAFLTTMLPFIVDWDDSTMDPRVTRHCIAKKSPSRVLLINVLNFVIPGFLLTRLYYKIFVEIKRKLRSKGNDMGISETTASGVSSQESALAKTDSNDVTAETVNDEFLGPPNKVGKCVILYRRERKASYILGIVIGAFFVCWTPYTLVTFIQAFAPKVTLPKHLSVICAVIGWVNSCVNPIVYGIMNTEFRNSFRRMASCFRK